MGQWSGAEGQGTTRGWWWARPFDDNTQILVPLADRYGEKWEAREVELILQSDNKYFAKK